MTDATAPLHLTIALPPDPQLKAGQFMSDRLFVTSGLRSQPAPETQEATGLAFHSRAIDWSAITATARRQGCTLLHFSPVDALVTPDADPPWDETPQTLAARVAAWKASGTNP
jgi:hypothetical protein